MKKNLIIIFGILAVILIGIGDERHTIGEVHKTVHRYITGEYHWTTTHPMLVGKVMTIQTHHHYRHETCSVIWEYNYVNGELVSSKSLSGTGEKVYEKHYPKRWNVKEDNKFTGYRQNEEIKDIVIFVDGETKTISDSDHYKYVHAVGHEVDYRTWYGIKLWVITGL